MDMDIEKIKEALRKNEEQLSNFSIKAEKGILTTEEMKTISQVYKESLACWLADKARDIRDAMDKL